MPATSSTITQDTDVCAALDTLKREARTLRDIEQWLACRPHLVGAPSDLPESLSVNVQIGYYPTRFVKSVSEDNLINVNVTYVINGITQPSAIIGALAPGLHGTSAQYFKQDFEMQLALDQWPVATALVAEEYSNIGVDLMRTNATSNFEDRVNKALALHFGATTVASLLDLVETGLVVTDEGHLDTQTLMAMLFTPLHNKTSSIIPTDLAP